MKKLITRDQEINLEIKNTVDSADLPHDIQDIKLVGDEHIDLYDLNLNIVKYELDKTGPYIHIANCNINKLVLNGVGIGNCNINKLVLNGVEIGNRLGVAIFNCNIQNIYIQSKIDVLRLENTKVPNLHGRVDLINGIIIEQ